MLNILSVGRTVLQVKLPPGITRWAAYLGFNRRCGFWQRNAEKTHRADLWAESDLFTEEEYL